MGGIQSSGVFKALYNSPPGKPAHSYAISASVSVERASACVRACVRACVCTSVSLRAALIGAVGLTVVTGMQVNR